MYQKQYGRSNGASPASMLRCLSNSALEANQKQVQEVSLRMKTLEGTRTSYIQYR